MAELVQLEKRHADFSKRNTRIIAASVEGTDMAQLTQDANPHLLILGDECRGLSDAVAVIHKDSNPNGGDTAAPTTILIDKSGIVRWLFRPGTVVERLSPDEVLAAVDTHVIAAR